MEDEREARLDDGTRLWTIENGRPAVSWALGRFQFHDPATDLGFFVAGILTEPTTWPIFRTSQVSKRFLRQRHV